MKTVRAYQLVVCLSLFGWLGAYAQPCQQEQPPDKLRSDIIEGFVFQAEQAGFISNDKGFVSLIEWTDTLGREVYSMKPVWVATYTEDEWLPRKYYKVKGYIVMVWEDEYKDLPIIAAQRKQLHQCLMSLVGDRIEPEPLPKHYWELETIRDSTGRARFDQNGYRMMKSKLNSTRPTITTGYPPGFYRYIFGKDGTVKRQPPFG